MLISQNGLSLIEDVCANQQYPLASHHFLVTAKWQVQVQNTQRQLLKPTYDLTPLQSFEKCNHFSALFEQHMSQAETVDYDCESANNLCDRMTAAFHEVAHTCLSPLYCKPREPWISISTLLLIKDRVIARQQNDAVAENS